MQAVDSGKREEGCDINNDWHVSKYLHSGTNIGSKDWYKCKDGTSANCHHSLELQEFSGGFLKPDQ